MLKQHFTSVNVESVVSDEGCAATKRTAVFHTTYAGFGSRQVDRLWKSGEIAIAPSGTHTIDLEALFDEGAGATVAMARVREIMVVNMAHKGKYSAEIAVESSGFEGPWDGAAGKNNVGPDDCLFLSNKTNGWACANPANDFVIRNKSTTETVIVKVHIVGSAL